MSMFTGIIEEIGIIKELKKTDKSGFIKVECKKILDGIKLGDSISINGVCQTVVEFDKTSFCAEISQQTLNITTFMQVKIGDKVNLERALTLNSRLGGHIVTGHIDGTAKITKIEAQGEFNILEFEAEKEISKYLIQKGSVTVNGISLTIAELKQNTFDIAVIPHTFANTNLKNLKTGDFVNIEVDTLAKYVEKFLSTDNNVSNKKTINADFLKENGFL